MSNNTQYYRPNYNDDYTIKFRYMCEKLTSVLSIFYIFIYNLRVTSLLGFVMLLNPAGIFKQLKNSDYVLFYFS